MWFFIKGSFWFSLVLVLLPVFSATSSARLANAPPVDMSDAMAAATGAYDYVSNICTAKPDVCEKGGKTFTALGYRAKEGALVAFDYLNSKFADRPADVAAASPASPAALKPSVPKLPPASAEAAAKAVDGGIAAQPLPPRINPDKPQPYRPPVADKVVTGTVLTHVPIPLPRPTQDFL